MTTAVGVRRGPGRSEWAHVLPEEVGLSARALERAGDATIVGRAITLGFLGVDDAVTPHHDFGRSPLSAQRAWAVLEEVLPQ